MTTILQEKPKNVGMTATLSHCMEYNMIHMVKTTKSQD